MLSRSLMFPRLATRSVRQIQTSSALTSGHHIEHWWGPERGAGRELVGFGSNGDNVSPLFVFLLVHLEAL